VLKLLVQKERKQEVERTRVTQGTEVIYTSGGERSTKRRERTERYTLPEGQEISKQKTTVGREVSRQAFKFLEKDRGGRPGREK